MVIIKKILIIISIIVLGILIVIPRSYFRSNTIQKTKVTEAKTLTNGPDYVNKLADNIIRIQAISGDMGNTIQYTISDLITQNEANEAMNSDISTLTSIKNNLEALKKEYPDVAQISSKWIDNINNLQGLSKTSIPYIQNFNQQELEKIEKEITYCFDAKVSQINNYSMNQEAYDVALANATSENNIAKTYIS